MDTDVIQPRSMLLQEFLPHVGALFLADCAPRSVALRLIEARPIAGHPAALRPPFSLLFHTEPEVLLVAGNYAVRTEGFGPDMIYISPVLPARDAAPGHYYEALFN